MPSATATETLDELLQPGVPGLVAVFSRSRPMAIPIPLGEGTVELGRGHELFSSLADPRLSRRHFRLTIGRRVVVEDLGSRNGTAVDGIALRPGTSREVHRVIRAGDTVLMPVRDVEVFLTFGIQLAGEQVIGPSTREALDAARLATKVEGRTALIVGESGTGKEAVARALHAAGPASAGPFQVMRCTTLPEADLEQLLFGGGPGIGGYLRAAQGGTLLLEGIARLSHVTQLRLLHLLVHDEVPVCGGPPEKIDVRFAFTTRRELRHEVTDGALLQDVYYRLAAPRLTAPPLRYRREEIPFLLAAEAARAAPGTTIEASLVEQCLLRAWPGNVRELLAEMRNAALAAQSAGSPTVGARFLDPAAGTTRASAPSARSAAAPAASAAPRQSHTALRAPLSSTTPHLRDQIAKALTDHRGNVTKAAQALGVQRTSLRRWLDRFDMNPRAFVAAGER